MKHLSLTFFLTLFFHVYAPAQEAFDNTLFYSEETGSPEANLQSVEWIAGHWRGEAFGGVTEEIWTPPLGGSMMCVFKLVMNNEVNFYEIVTITEKENTLLLQLKHFYAGLQGWEEKDEVLDFRLVKISENKVYFDGFTFERINKNELNIYVVIENKGVKQETKFHYKRVGS